MATRRRATAATLDGNCVKAASIWFAASALLVDVRRLWLLSSDFTGIPFIIGLGEQLVIRGHSPAYPLRRFMFSDRGCPVLASYRYAGK